MRKNFFIINLVLLFSFISVYSQQITGYIKDENNNPIKSASVYFSGTSKGIRSDADGHFVLTQLPLGYQELIVSSLGYSKYKSTIEIHSNIDTIINIKLKSTPIKLKDLTVEAERDKNWDKYLNKFKTAFFGKTDNSKSIEIVNPEVLTLKEEKIDKKSVFSANTDNTLIFKNILLGYIVSVDIDEFKAINDNVYYKLSLVFEEMKPENIKQKTAWENNRIKAYKGSLKHYLYSLINQNSVKNGFRSRQIPRVEPGYKDLVNGKEIDSLDKMLLKTEKPNYYKVNFPEFLLVLYSKGSFFSSAISSKLEFNGKDTYVDIYGNLFDPNFNLLQYGEWSKKRFADVLPTNYIPEE